MEEQDQTLIVEEQKEADGLDQRLSKLERKNTIFGVNIGQTVKIQSMKRSVKTAKVGPTETLSFFKQAKEAFIRRIPVKIDTRHSLEDFVLSKDREFAYGVSSQGTFNVINIAKNDSEPFQMNFKNLTKIAVNKNSSEAFIIDNVGRIIVYDIRELEIKFHHKLLNDVKSFSYADSLSAIVVSTQEGDVFFYVWNGSEIHLKDTIECKLDKPSQSLVSPNGKYILTFGNTGLILFKLKRNGNKKKINQEQEMVKFKNKIICECSWPVTHAFISKNWFGFIVSGENFHLRRIDQSLRDHAYFKINENKLESLLISEDQKYLMAIYSQKTAKIWDLHDEDSKEAEIHFEAKPKALKFGIDQTITFLEGNNLEIRRHFAFKNEPAKIQNIKQVFLGNNTQESLLVHSNDELSEVLMKNYTFYSPISMENVRIQEIKYLEEDIFCMLIIKNNSYTLKLEIS